MHGFQYISKQRQCYNKTDMKDEIKEVVSVLFGLEIEPDVSVPEEQFGDLATNVAMQITKQVGDNPRLIAEKIAEKLRGLPDVTEVSVAGPGFINIRLSDEYLVHMAQAEPAKSLIGKKVLVEYS